MPRGPRPKSESERARTNAPVHDWKTAPGTGWQHGEVPQAPDGLMPASVDAWKTWFGAWFASYWKPEDLPGLRQVIRLYDQVERSEFQRAAELRLQMDTYGITPKGQQDRRWKPPVSDAGEGGSVSAVSSPYGHLRSVGS